MKSSKSINPPIRGSIVKDKEKRYEERSINPPIRGSIGIGTVASIIGNTILVSIPL